MLFGCSRLSRFQATLILISWFSKFPGISKNAFSQLLSILHTKILPENNTLPTSYPEAISMLKSHLTPVKEYHCCTNDCVVFRDSKTHAYKGLSVQFVERVGTNRAPQYPGKPSSTCQSQIELSSGSEINKLHTFSNLIWRHRCHPIMKNQFIIAKHGKIYIVMEFLREKQDHCHLPSVWMELIHSLRKSIPIVCVRCY